jgi:hypothetical protein
MDLGLEALELLACAARGQPGCCQLQTQDQRRDEHAESNRREQDLPHRDIGDLAEQVVDANRVAIAVSKAPTRHEQCDERRSSEDPTEQIQ